VATVDLRKIGLSRSQWRELRLEAKRLGVEAGPLVEAEIVPEWLRAKRRRKA
jgi:hypothetical protein